LALQNRAVFFAEAYPEGCKTDLNIQDLVSSDKSLQWLFDQVEEGLGSGRSATTALFDTQLSLGRNVFRGIEGFSRVDAIAESLWQKYIITPLTRILSPMANKSTALLAQTILGQPHEQLCSSS
jgi:hypothetical protein